MLLAELRRQWERAHLDACRAIDKDTGRCPSEEDDQDECRWPMPPQLRRPAGGPLKELTMNWSWAGILKKRPAKPGVGHGHDDSWRDEQHADQAGWVRSDPCAVCGRTHWHRPPEPPPAPAP